MSQFTCHSQRLVYNRMPHSVSWLFLHTVCSEMTLWAMLAPAPPSSHAPPLFPSSKLPEGENCFYFVHRSPSAWHCVTHLLEEKQSLPLGNLQSRRGAVSTPTELVSEDGFWIFPKRFSVKAPMRLNLLGTIFKEKLSEITKWVTSSWMKHYDTN